MVIACLALGVALSGSSIAASVKDAVNGTQVARNTLPGNRVETGTLPANRIKPDSLTGRQVNESRLAKVPSAVAADTAADAAALGGRPAGATARSPPSRSPPARRSRAPSGSRRTSAARPPLTCVRS